MGGGSLQDAFEGTQGATRESYEAALEIEKSYQHKEKVSPKGGKPKDDVAGWIKEWRPRVGEDGKSFAKRIMDLKYGEGNYKVGAGREYSQAQKYADTHFKSKTRRK